MEQCYKKELIIEKLGIIIKTAEDCIDCLEDDTLPKNEMLNKADVRVKRLRYELTYMPFEELYYDIKHNDK